MIRLMNAIFISLADISSLEFIAEKLSRWFSGKSINHPFESHELHLFGVWNKTCLSLSFYLAAQFIKIGETRGFTKDEKRGHWTKNTLYTL